MKMILKRILCVAILFFCIGSVEPVFAIKHSVPIKKNMLTKVLHHRSSMDALELGQIVFCFTQEPTVDVVPKKEHGDHHEIAFFFPSTGMNSAAKDMAHDISAASTLNQSYQLVIKEVAHGVKLIITYNPSKVGIEYDSFTNIDLLKGIVFRFYNKELLDSLRNNPGTLLRTASASHKQRIVIDCGHGGTDSGAISASGLAEKDVTLNVGLETASLLRSKGFDVLLTRDSDVTMALDARTTLANLCHATIFVSIHNNSAKDASGIETFCLDSELFSTTSVDHEPDFFKAARDRRNDRNDDSVKLATCLQNNTLAMVKKKHASVVDRKVKKSVTQVISGVDMPAVLIEVCFLSNPLESKLLATDSFCRDVAQGICNGVVEYAHRRVV